ncbi:MAG: Cof-type HAD-IIB family hydrolase [Filifactor alocis]|nr:Cof-type HAD-IIB family hydrolase [Filifactor alocis]
MFELIASDLDGTLLENVAGYSDETYRSVRELIKKGMRFIVATGRIYRSASLFAKSLGTKDYVISCNGAYVRHTDTGEVLLEERLPKEALLTMMDYLDEKEAFYCIYDAETIYSRKPTGLVEHYLRLNKSLEPEDRIRVEITDEFKEVVEKGGRILKLVVLEKRMELLNEWKSVLSEMEDLEVVQSSDTNMEIMKKGVSKGRGLRLISERYGIDPERIIAFGDHLNDASMLEYAGIGVAMGNAGDELKKMADYVTDTNTKDGFSKAMRHILEGRVSR